MMIRAVERKASPGGGRRARVEKFCNFCRLVREDLTARVT